ncbi:site-specific integrase [Siminovitchia terrae]|uniref:Site-specific integrase n=1 Tax=Siminovitchia terrae TaxID=1914933 RepID=A0ABQ4KZD0_SIMTE|nr:site-specific integrase [Siminovitchia terrae]GIN96930.1 site-specific integrase [Siminovitchia terrae]
MPDYKKLVPNLKEINGKWTFTATLGTNPNTGKKIQKRRGGCETQKEAYEKYIKILADWEIEKRNMQEKSNADNITFKDFLDEKFIRYYKNKVSPQTFQTRKSILNNYYHSFYNKPINKITFDDVEDWHQELIAKRKEQGKKTHNHVRLVKQLLSMIFDYAIHYKKLTGCINNPVKEVDSLKRDGTDIKFWTKSEFEKVCSTFYLDDFYQHFGFITLNFLFMTGLRIGEAQALTWDDIDLEDGIVHVTKTLIYKNASQHETDKPKTKSSIRRVALDEGTVELLNEWKIRQQKQINTDWVFSYNGIPTNKHTISHILKRHAKLADVKRITPHGLRHSHASLLIHMKEDPLILKERLGHSDIQITLGIYGHLYPNRDFELASRLSNVVKRDFSKKDLTDNQGNQYLKLASISSK